MGSFVDLQQQRYLPPDDTAASLLDTRFLVADTPDEAELLVSDSEPDLYADMCPVLAVPILVLRSMLKSAVKLALSMLCARWALHAALRAYMTSHCAARGSRMI